MGFIRGKIECDREVKPKTITVGGPSPFRQCPCCDKWFDEQGNECAVTTLAELFKGLNEPICKPKERGR